MAAAEDAPRTVPEGGPRRALVRGIASRWLALLALASALSFGGAWWWVLDLLSHFHAIYLLLALVAAATLAALRSVRGAAAAAVLVVFEAALVLPLHAGAWGSSAASASAARLRVVSYNMLHGNPHTAAAARHVAELEPDVVVLLEATAPQLQAFTAALPGFHAIVEPRDDAFGIAVLSRVRPTSARVVWPGPRWTPAIALELPLGERAVTVFAVHPPPPVSEEYTRTRDELLRTVSGWAAAQGGPVLVVGDLNATPWSAVMREILGDGPLRSTQRFGLHGTWPASLGALGLPIDHALVAGPLEPVHRGIEPAFGSDHRMLVVELALE